MEYFPVPLWLFQSLTEKAKRIHITWSFQSCPSQPWLLVTADCSVQPTGLHKSCFLHFIYTEDKDFRIFGDSNLGENSSKSHGFGNIFRGVWLCLLNPPLCISRHTNTAPSLFTSSLDASLITLIFRSHQNKLMPFYFTIRHLRIWSLCTKDFLLLDFQTTPCFCSSNNQSFTEEPQLKDEELDAVPIFAFPPDFLPGFKPFVVHWQ